MVLTKPFIEADALKQISNLRHGFFTRRGGVSSGIFQSRNIGLGSTDHRADVLENRARCARDLEAEVQKLATPHQIHSADVMYVDTVWAQGKGPKVDALVTDRPGIMIGIATADCGPVLFVDPDAAIIGAAHAGWRGATGGVLENTLAAMESRGASVGRTIAVLGPTIAQNSYEVGPEFVENLLSLTADNEIYFKPSQKHNHALFDLPAYITDRLNRAGVKEACNLGLDTYDNEEDFFSYRRTTHRQEADYGRLLAAIVMKEPKN